MKYGDRVLELDVPSRLFGRYERFGATRDSGPSGGPALAATDHATAAVRELRAAGFGARSAGRHLALMVSDGTREDSVGLFLESLAADLAAAGAVTVFVCTGTHDPASPENVALAEHLERRLSGLGLPATHRKLVLHDARRHPLTSFGSTSRGTRIEINAALDTCEVFLVVANMKNHYFAGYSNPVKYLVPGIAAYETARGNHSLTLEDGSSFGRHPWHPSPERRDNPLAVDMLEAFERVVGERPHFSLVVVGSSEHVAWAGGGETRDVSARGMSVVDRLASLELEPTRFLVVSPGGRPHDESLYTAQRALELSRAAVVDGGEVLFLARCQNGIGPPSARENFFEPLSRSLAEVCRRPSGEYLMYSHKSYKFGLYLSGLAAVHVVSDLPAEEVRGAHMHPAVTAQSVLDRWAVEAGPADRVTLIDDASRFAVHARRERS
jgi:nickel-dependent lactate racemase